jgi:DNA-binding response OmpR family regulator
VKAPPKILVVEDDKKLALALSLRLRAKRYDVKVAYDAVGGVMVASKEKPDLVVLDISMPAGGGFTVAERMQNLAATAGIPIIFLTASNDPAHRQRARELGAAAFLEKPYEIEELLEAIKRALSRSPLRHRPRAGW